MQKKYKAVLSITEFKGQVEVSARLSQTVDGATVDTLAIEALLYLKNKMDEWTNNETTPEKEGSDHA